MAGPRALTVTLVVALLGVACGKGDRDEHGDAPTGGSPSAARAGGGAGGEGGDEPAGSLEPTFDCRDDDASKTCIAVRGTVDGELIDRHCASPQMGNLLTYSPNAWLAECAESGDRETGWWYRISTPERASGSFVIPFDPSSTNGAGVAVAFEQRGGEFSSDNFEEGQLSGTIRTDPTSGHTIISGTFRATWGEPTDKCSGGVAVLECAAVDVVGNYYVEHFLTFD